MMGARKLSTRGKEGGIAIALLVIAFTLCMVTASYLRYSVNNARWAARARDLQQAKLLAGSALDSAKAQMQIAIENAALGLTGGSLEEQLNDRNIIKFPQLKGNESDFEIAVMAMEVPGNGQFTSIVTKGKEEQYQDINIVVGVRNKKNGVSAACSESVKIIREPFLRYLIFFHNLLELHPGPPMYADGDIRSNNGIEFFANNLLQIDGTVRCTGDLRIFKSDQSESWNAGQKDIGSTRVKVADADGNYQSFFMNGGYLDSTVPQWDEWSQDRWNGRVETGPSVESLTPPLGRGVDNHVLIEPSDGIGSLRIRNEKMANKADLYVKVDSSGSATYQVGGKQYSYDSSDYAQPTDKGDFGVYALANDGWLNVHTDYADPREGDTAFEHGPQFGSSAQTMRMVDIYMDKLLERHPDCNVVYVEVQDPSNSSLKPAVRLRNGADLSRAGSDGISVATHRTLYVEGDYNSLQRKTVVDSDDNGNGHGNNGHGNNEDGVDSSNPGKSKEGNDTDPNVDDEKKDNGNGKNTGKVEGDSETAIELVPGKVPALLAADNLTLLSNSWDDSNSRNSSKASASDTTLNAALMIGYNDPENLPGKPGTTFTGGAHNLVRFRENWSGKNYNFCGSYISLWHAQDSHCLISGATYSPPNRNIKYDQSFRTIEPPGMPNGYTDPITVYWKEISLDDALAFQKKINNKLDK